MGQGGIHPENLPQECTEADGQIQPSTLKAMSTTKIIKGWVNPDQARRSSDGYDGGIVRLNVYGPDEPNAGCDIYDYDEPATLYIGPGKLWTEDEVRAMLRDIQIAMARDMITTSEGRLVDNPPAMEIRDIAAKHGLTI